jgi:hypothetical protein
MRVSLECWSSRTAGGLLVFVFVAGIKASEISFVKELFNPPKIATQQAAGVQYHVSSKP